MSKESYMAGFCKKAAEHNVDPCKLAQFAARQLEKDAAGDVWGTVRKFLETAKQNAGKVWNSIDPKLRPLAGGAIGAGIGAGGGAILGKLLGVGAGKGAIAGLGIGGISGSALGAKSWNDFVTAAHKNEVDKLNEEHKYETDGLKKQVNKIIAERESDAKAHADDVAKLNARIRALQVARGARTNNNSELEAAIKELEAQKKQIQNQAARNFAEQFMEKWKATQAAPEAKK